jgi:uroporphyrinogen decarboxylase
MTPSSNQAHTRLAVQLVAAARANGGLAPVDVDRFWADNEAAARDPFAATAPQVPLGATMSWECVFDELGVEEDAWRFLHDDAWANDLIDRYNEKAQRIVGRRLLVKRENTPAGGRWPEVKWLHDIFEARNVWHGGSWWLQQAAHSETELGALLDRVEARLADLRRFVLPEGWDECKDRLVKAGVAPPLYRGQRGPVTFATSVYGTEDLLILLMTNPALAERFRDTILRAMLALGRVLDDEAGYAPGTAPRGFSFCDDNCCLLSPELYEFFGYPILDAIFGYYAPAPADWRYQHSDSAMGHLLPILGSLNLTQANLGPTLSVSEIRNHMPQTIIQGQLAPFTFSRNEEQKIVCEFMRDYEMAREKRGLLFATAGSINNGSRLSGMRLMMSAIQKYGRYR